MTNRSKIFIILTLFAVIGIGYSVSNSSTPESKITVVNNNEFSEDVSQNEAAFVETNQAGEVMAESAIAGDYIDYDAAAIASSEAKHIVLNFSATWCPSCRSLDKDINANLSTIPNGVEIYKIDYDSNVALRQQYGVTVQHTLVEITADGTMINKWSGGNTLDSILAKL
jgi:thiol-disulfide isomerase/thioredoxin